MRYNQLKITKNGKDWRREVCWYVERLVVTQKLITVGEIIP
jgi:hypothetical protein